MKAVPAGRIAAAVAAAAMGALVLAGVAAADKEKIDLTPAGQAAARAAVLTRADIGTASGWTGGARKPDLSATLQCPSFRPKQSDLVLIGADASTWKHAGLELDSEAQVLRTPEMMRLDWQRSVLVPEVVPCLRSVFSKQAGAGGRLVSLGRIAFPRIGEYTRAYRGLLDVQASGATVRVMIDIVLVGRGSTEITLTSFAPFAAEPSVAAAEVRLARALAARVHA